MSMAGSTTAEPSPSPLYLDRAESHPTSPGRLARAGSISGGIRRNTSFDGLSIEIYKDETE
eukprot:CAMPEP_0182597146 /NCGR_PEP_ID=MMETSP1324-20130603/85636_1 /TAXON_ID=236786 /ORGANISM="Florenciella sp., Strain RCC1587" /LENGTH=60 /DNA_ID=CAMNT_0024814877 /DNA_START=90 /DNA_END=269 /DNA_ORIENTATION=+